MEFSLTLNTKVQQVLNPLFQNQLPLILLPPPFQGIP